MTGEHADDELDVPPPTRPERERSFLLKEAVREVFKEQLGNEEKRKELLKQAISEWLDAKFLQFGKWTFYGLLAAALAGLALIAFVKFGISIKVT